MFKLEINLINKTLYLTHLLIKQLTVRKEALIYKKGQKTIGHGLVMKKRN
jgi:hypothetical protein